MRPALEKRLQRLHADLRREERAALAPREGLRARVAVGGEIRRMLVERGIDPAEIVALRQVDEAAAELAEMGYAGGRDAEAAADAGHGIGREAEGFIRELVRLALLHYADGERPDPARSSLMEWHAWCLVTPQSRHHRNIPLDPEVVRYQQMLRLGRGGPRSR